MDSAQVTEAIINASMKVHSALGVGLSEWEYEDGLAGELSRLGLKVERQVVLPDASGEVRRKQVLGLSLSMEELGGSLNIRQEPLVAGIGERPDLVVEDSVIVELKAVKRLRAEHEAQLYSYLKLSRRQVGLLINFHAPDLRDGIKRIINEL